MTSIASFVGWDCLWLLLCMAAVAAVIGTFAGLTLLAQRLYGRRVTRELRQLDDGLPGHTAGRVRATRRHRRQLHRDLVLLLVVNADRTEDA